MVKVHPNNKYYCLQRLPILYDKHNMHLNCQEF